MVESRQASLPRRVRDAAADWVDRGQRHPGPAYDTALAAWLASDPEHMIAYQEALLDWQASAELGTTRTGQARRLVRAPFLLRRNTHIAAAGLATAALMLVAVGPARLVPPWSVISEASAQTLTTAKGEIRTVRLSDGSRVTLDTDTVVRISFTSTDRIATLLRGRARFDVASDAARPFLVEAQNSAIRGMPATFDVAAATLGSLVSAIKGRVTVALRSSPVAAATTLVAGEQIDTGRRDGVGTSDPRASQWVAGMLVVDATPLGDVVAAMNRYSRVPLRLGDPELERLTVSGAFRVSDPTGFVRSVEMLYHLRVAHSSDGGWMLRRATPEQPTEK